ncbi:MAG: DUF421 domain-containing protein [Firmicutes bacterium]|nr:DUF421 domain-containing protein [Bacillota bacterium]
MLSILRRSLESFVFALVLLRLTGRKSISQLNYFDFFTVNIMGSLFSNYITDPAQGLEIFLAPVAITAADLLADRLAIKSRQARRLLEGEPVIFVKNGKILEKNIAKMHYNIDEVLAALRYEGIYDLNDVEFAVLEIDGSISVLKKSQSRPLAPKDLNIPTQYEGLPSIIISDGKILPENLQKNNLNHSWLENKLKEQGINDTSQVFLASLATDGSLYVDLKDS